MRPLFPRNHQHTSQTRVRSERAATVGRLQERLGRERAVGEILRELPEDADSLVTLPLPEGIDPLRVGAGGLNNPATSQLLRCPAEGCAMSQQPGFNDGDTSSYTQFLNWIIGGALDN